MSLPIRAVLTEAFASARSQPVSSVLAAFMVATMSATLLLTIGRTEGTQRRVLETIDSAGTRSIVMRAAPDAGATTEILSRIQSLQGIERAIGFGPSTDVSNVAFTDFDPVSMRTVYARPDDPLGNPSDVEGDGLVSTGADRQLRLADHTGAVRTSDGEVVTIAGKVELPAQVSFLEPVVLIPGSTAQPEPLGLLVITVKRPEQIQAISRAVKDVLAVADPSKITVESSAQLADLRGQVSGRLGSLGRGLVLLLTMLTGALLSTILYGLVMLRRKDFGRRRALGASRQLIICLIVAQTATTALMGLAIGNIVSLIAIVVSNDPFPSLSLFAAVDIVTVGLALVAAVAPAIAASRRDPITELRVP